MGACAPDVSGARRTLSTTCESHVPCALSLAFSLRGEERRGEERGRAGVGVAN
jgi:hypothetical protein